MEQQKSRLEQQMDFILEVDKMKSIYRQTLVLGEDRRENDAEHSWHLALMAFLLAEHANQEIDTAKVMRMVLIHDIVEVDAGDTYCYDEAGNQDKEEREEKAAKRLFSLLPPDQGEALYALWREFEENQTPEAQYANALDRTQPVTLNYSKGGISWKEHGITHSQAMKRNSLIQEGSEALFGMVKRMLDDGRKKGMLLPDTFSE